LIQRERHVALEVLGISVQRFKIMPRSHLTKPMAKPFPHA
jgi:hypothetical protein